MLVGVALVGLGYLVLATGVIWATWRERKAGADAFTHPFGDVVKPPVEAKFGGPVNRKAGGVSRGTARTADTQTHHNRPARTQDKGGR